MAQHATTLTEAAGCDAQARARLLGDLTALLAELPEPAFRVVLVEVLAVLHVYLVEASDGDPLVEH